MSGVICSLLYCVHFPAVAVLLLHMALQRLCEECPLIDICQHFAELKVTLAKGLILDSDFSGAEDPHFFAIGICFYKVSLVR